MNPDIEMLQVVQESDAKAGRMSFSDIYRGCKRPVGALASRRKIFWPRNNYVDCVGYTNLVVRISCLVSVAGLTVERIVYNYYGVRHITCKRLGGR